MKKDDTYRSQFRLPYELYEKLKEESEKNHRSLNAEIVARLQESLGDGQIGHASQIAHAPPELAPPASYAQQIAKEVVLNFSKQAAQEVKDQIWQERKKYFDDQSAIHRAEELYGKDFLPDILKALQSTQNDMKELHATIQRYFEDATYKDDE